MKRRLPPLNWLRSFEAAARLLGFTAAAEELNLTQAAVSQHIKSLEQYLGSPLFIRLARSLRLTDHGRAYQQRVGPVLDQLAMHTDEVFGYDTTNQLIIRVNAAFSVLWLAARIGKFLKLFPEIDLRITNPVWAVGGIEDGADFEIQYGLGDWQGLEVTQLTRDDIFPICHPEKHQQVTADFESLQRIHVMGYRDGWAQWLKAANMEGIDPSTGLKCDNSIMAFEMAANGAGITIARQSLAYSKLDQGHISRPFDTSIVSSENFYLVRPTVAPLSPAQDAFKEWIIQEAADFHNMVSHER